MTRKLFTADRFVPTPHSTAEEKVRFTAMTKISQLGGSGHRQYILGAQDGSVRIVHRIYLYSWQEGQIVNMPLLNGEPDWCAMQGVECPERLPNCPEPVLEACHGKD